MKMRDILLPEDATSPGTVKTIKPSMKPARDSYQSKAPPESRQQDGGSSRYQEDHDPGQRGEPDDPDLQDDDHVEREDHDHPFRPDVRKLGDPEEFAPRPIPSIAPRPRKPDPRVKH